MRFDRIGAVQHCSDTALRPVACAVLEIAFGHQSDPEVFCQSQGERLAREATTDDENVKLVHGSRGAGEYRRLFRLYHFTTERYFLTCLKQDRGTLNYFYCVVSRGQVKQLLVRGSRRHRIYWAPLRMTERIVHNNLEAGR